ncbi:MAG: hypothetical protein IJJ26_11855 [Victivallales bacterium]|nr:hypothetical protein [Victivallales bacterium]
MDCLKKIVLGMFLVCMGGLCAPAEGEEETCKVERRSLPVVTTVRVKTTTAESEKINNPINWQPLQSIVEDGSHVKKDDVVATFVSEESEYEMTLLVLQQKRTEADVEARVRDIDNQNLELSEQMDVLQDRLASLEAKLERQLSEPTADDIAIVEGRLRIAKLNLDAAEKEYTKAQDRFKRQMISRAELEKAEKDLETNRAKEIHARKELEITKNPPTREDEIKMTRVDIDTAKLEIEKLQFEIEDQLEISEIQRRAALVSKDRIKRRIDEQQENIDKRTVRAPAEGYVSLNRYDNNELVPGVRMWRSFRFMEIPNLNTIQFEGLLPEARRPYHAVGDRVVLLVDGRKDRPLGGTIKTISTLSHDLSEKGEDAGWNRDERGNGVKVFDIAIELDEAQDWIRPGMFGVAEIRAEQANEGYSVPLQFVKQRDGKSYLSVDGTYVEVSGQALGGYFVLDGDTLQGREVGLHGVFPEERVVKEEGERSLTATGEVKPVKSKGIIVRDIGWWPWPKITWLMPEESMVKAGDVVAKLDPEERKKQVQAQEEGLIENRSRRDELAKKVEINRRNEVFRLKVAQNNLEQARLNLHTIESIVPPLPLNTAILNLRTAQLNYEAQKRDVEREEARPTPTMSPAELEKKRRELERRKLKVEQATIRKQIAAEGSTVLARSKAQQKLINAEDNLEQVRRQCLYDSLSLRREYERQVNHVKRLEKRLDARKEQVENHVIKSPSDGLLCYNKVYNSGVVTKIAVGITVGPNFELLSIPDLSQMELKVEVDEKYYSQVKAGMKVGIRIPSLSERLLDGEVKGVDLLFHNRRRKDTQIGLYSSHEPLGEVVFDVRILIDPGDVPLKPGILGEVIFPISK